MIWIISILLTTAITLIIYALAIEEGRDDSQRVSFTAAIGGGIAMLAIFLLQNLLNGVTPSAIDVYRGNTSLQISYIDSIAVDSIVIFKE